MRELKAVGVLQNGSMQLTPLLCPTPVGMAFNAFVSDEDMQGPIVHVLSEVTCSFSETRLSHGQRSPQVCIRFNNCRISSGDVFRDGLTPQDISEVAD